MKSSASRVLGAIPPVRKILPLPSIALASVMAYDGSIVYASSDKLYKGAIFGRDSLEVAEDLILVKPELVHNILLTLGGLQGQKYRIENEEEPGKIIHEYRTSVIGGKPLIGSLKQRFEELNAKWGGDGKTLIYYGSVDSTPQFLRVLHKYCSLYGNTILVQKTNTTALTMREVAQRATTWLTQKLDASLSGLLEYKPAGPLSIRNQAWKDSDEFYVHENKEPVNHAMPIASVEVQGLAYDALLAASWFFPEMAATYQARATTLRDRTLELLWQPERRYMALGTDCSPVDGSLRIINTTTSNPAELLDSGFFDDVEHSKQQEIVGAIVRRIMGSDFLTNAGIRSRSLVESDLVTFWDYHGSYVSWPKDTYDIAKGLRRQGFAHLSLQLENRLLNLVRRTRDYPEFVYVDGWGRVLPGIPLPLHSKTTLDIRGTNAPERNQAWTISAIMAIMSSRSRLRPKQPVPSAKSEAWQDDIETTILSTIPNMNIYINPLRLWLQYPTHSYKLTSPHPA